MQRCQRGGNKAYISVDFIDSSIIVGIGIWPYLLYKTIKLMKLDDGDIS